MSSPIAFSTLGCPAWNLDQILRAATDCGYDAVELRGYLDQMDLPRAQPFTPENRVATRRRFEDAGVAVCCVSSSGIVAQGNTDHVRAHAELARDLDCPLVRIFGGERTERSVENLRAFGDAAAEAGVALVLETHDAFSTGATVAALLAEADHPAVFSLWDLHHPYRQGEAPEDTHSLLRPTLRHVHAKDSRDGAYTLPGDGDIPLVPMLDALVASGYDGPVSVEWEKRWHPEIADPEIALPAYAAFLRAHLAPGGSR